MIVEKTYKKKKRKRSSQDIAAGKAKVSNTDLFHEAFTLHNTGNLAKAASLYRKILKNEPKHVDANFLLGTLNIQQGKLKPATTLLKKAISLKPDHVAASNNLGTALQSQGNFSEAEVIYNNIIERTPDYVEGHINLGAVLQEQGKLDEAIKCYNRAIPLKPDYAEAHYNLGNALKRKNEFDEAAASYSQAIKLNPDYVQAHSNLGTVLQEQGKLVEAVSSFRKAIELKPEYAEAHSNLGTVLQEQGKLREAAESFHLAAELNPNHAEVHNNIGTFLMELGKPDEAIESYEKAITLEPDHAEAHNNLGAAFQEQGKFNEAIPYYKKAISLKPDYAEAHMNRSFVLLLTGNLEEGWPEYEWRLHTKDRVPRSFQQPLWDGTPLDGRSILVHAEQGIGDTIQFVRYLPMVQAKGGHVIFECQKNLFRLLENSEGLNDIIQKASTSEENSYFDVQVPLLSLPGIFGTTLENIPSKVPYIKVDPEPVKQWNARIENNDDFKIGIVWAGSPDHKNDRNRSCRLEDFSQLAEIPGLSFYSVQKGVASQEALTPPAGMKIINLANELNDFTDTAALILNLDLVISVDTSVAHLAGAIGIPVWNLLPFAPEWRWQLNRAVSPWYPRPNARLPFVGQGLAGRAGMRLFRQSQPNDWTGVFKQVKKALISEITTENIL
ncbi:MAG: Cell division coordinator CpoB [Candidatus Scalindua arabica]|uniref:Cell division coordinator CpoB n=1 Tax=Candidatus Scalindua arabica TaxID=1127984 RepID=A0A941W374_9BACT|nr:Cell division coordinator CpoB [Candidatus Scalindua arabica]